MSADKATDQTMTLWNSVCWTDRQWTYPYKSDSGGTLTAVNPMYNIRRATELWGPCGGRWGFEVQEQRYAKGRTLIDKDNCQFAERFHTVIVKLWYPTNDDPKGPCGYIEHAGGTTVCGVDSQGRAFSEHDHLKCSITDAVSKALSLLGFSADLWLQPKSVEPPPRAPAVNQSSIPTAAPQTPEPPTPVAPSARPDAPMETFGRASQAILKADTTDRLEIIRQNYQSGRHGFSPMQLDSLNKMHGERLKALSAPKQTA